MNEKSIKVNYLLNASYQLIAIIVPFITTPYISRVLSANGVGLYSYTYSIVCYFTLIATLGTATYGVRIIGIYQSNIEERSKYFWEIFIFRSMISSLMLILYLIYVIFYSENKLLSFLQMFYIIGVIFDITWFFQGLENFKKIAIRNLLIKLLNIIYIFIFIKRIEDLGKYIFGLSFLFFIGNLNMWICLPKYITKMEIKKLRPFKHTGIIIQLFIPTVAIQIYSILDKSMIGWFSPSSNENGYYEQAEKVIKMCLMVITSLGTVMIPRISKEFERKNYVLVQQYLMKSFRFVWFLGVPMMFGIIGITKIFVPVFFGSGFEKVSILLPIFSILFISMGINHTIGNQFLISTGQQNKYTLIITIGGVINFILNLILIPSLYSLGASIASVTGETVSAIIGLVVLSKSKQIKLFELWKLLSNYLLAGIFMLFGLLYLSNMLIINLSSLIIMLFTGIILYFFMLYILKDTVCIEGIMYLRKLLGKINISLRVK
jgi:O-antigen/teichoic acid export membrane protein